jgi:hypothetical protein
MRVCCICQSKEVYVDVYDSNTIVRYEWPKKSHIDPPKHYCEKHFNEKVWKKK